MLDKESESTQLLISLAKCKAEKREGSLKGSKCHSIPASFSSPCLLFSPRFLLLQARLAANVPRTIENTRLANNSIIAAPNTHDGPGPSTSTSLLDEEEQEDSIPQQAETDEFDDPHAPPALLITTSLPSNSTSPHLSSANARSHPSTRVREFVSELLSIFPGAEYRARSKAKGAGIGKISGWARTRGYNALIVIGEDKKIPVSLTLVSLPDGPTAFFRLTSLSFGKEIYGHARSTGHTPELILNNFTTSLGISIGKIFQNLFPKVPELEGRQVITAHNQRDFLFFRRHRYEFKSENRAKLQEIGPRFTLKLRKLYKGLPKGSGEWDGEYHFDGKDSSRKEEEEEERKAREEVDDGKVLEGEEIDGGKKGQNEASTSNGKRKRTGRGTQEEAGVEFEWKVSYCLHIHKCRS